MATFHEFQHKLPADFMDILLRAVRRSVSLLFVRATNCVNKSGCSRGSSVLKIDPEGPKKSGAFNVDHFVFIMTTDTMTADTMTIHTGTIHTGTINSLTHS